MAYVLKFVSNPSPVENASKDHFTGITAAEIRKARDCWIKLSQRSEENELLSSVSNGEGKVHGKYRRLAVYKDEEDIWRVGSRLQEYTPFTNNNKPPAFIPRSSRLSMLLMELAHRHKHVGIQETVSQFRMMGYWTTGASKLAKSVKTRCVICRILDKKPIQQEMGSIPGLQLVQPIAWGYVEMDLFGPIVCRSDVHKRSSIKVWGLVIVDKNSGAVHCDIMLDYSSQETIKALRRFASLRGWPVQISSDPGSQLTSSSGRLESWWNQMKGSLSELAATSNFSWEISPANSPWRQGRAEVRIKSIKRLLSIAVGNVRLSPLELQTVLFEIANLSNERPIGVAKTPREDGSFRVLTPNCLLMGRSSNAVPDDACLASHMKKSDRYQLIHQVTSHFWSLWAKEVTPESLIRQKWHETGRNLKPGDVVLLHEKTEIKGKYQIGIVESVKEGKDSLVRSCTIRYTIPNPKDPINIYSGGKKITVTRSVQRLTLLLPVEEQSGPLDVDVRNKLVRIESN